MKQYLTLLCVAVAGLCACDPARRIEMRNSTADTAEIIWRVKEDSIGFNAFNLSNNRELKFTLPPNRKAPIKMSFGIGVWSPSEVEKLIQRLEWYQVRSAAGELRIDSLPLLKDYLLSRRKGSSKIEILIDK
jgi:hypothetical protein